MSEANYSFAQYANPLTITENILDGLISSASGLPFHSDLLLASFEWRECLSFTSSNGTKLAEEDPDLVAFWTKARLPVQQRAGELIAALKGLEGVLAVKLANSRIQRSGRVSNTPVRAEVDVIHAGMHMYLCYVSSVDEFDVMKGNVVDIMKLLRDMDVHKSWGDVYKRAVTAIYRTKDDRFYHLHGGLNSVHTLEMLGHPTSSSQLPFAITDHFQAHAVIEERTMELTSAELDELVIKSGVSGSPCFSRGEFLATPHGKAMSKEPLFSLETLETSSPPLSQLNESSSPTRHQLSVLSSIKILDVTRIIAGPVISRTLAEYGADVLRVTPLHLADVTHFQVDFNFGKRTIDLNLQSPEGRATFERLLNDVDVVIDGYRPGALEKLGYGPTQLMELFKNTGREKGFVYCRENCYGWEGEWQGRPGWQQIADSVSGMSWEIGKSLGKNEPVGPPAPLADFGAAQVGAVAVLNALYHRMVNGGSYLTQTSLTKFNDFLLSLPDPDGHPSVPQIPEEQWTTTILGQNHPLMATQLTYKSNYEHCTSAALQGLAKLCPEVVGLRTVSGGDSSKTNDDDDGYMIQMDAHFGRVRTLKPVVKMNKYKHGWLNATRWPAWDEPEWLPSQT